MQVTDVYLAGLGVFQPPTVDAGQAARRGEYDPATYLENRLTGVCVAGDISPPEMAVHAARQAVSRAAADPGGIGMVLHASVFAQGPQMWHPVAYIQKEIAGNAAPTFEVRQGCNGVFAALELAASRMCAMEPDQTVLLTSAENCGSMPIDRWNCASGMLVGDAGSALLLSRRTGFARLLAVGSTTMPELEELYRAGEPLYPLSPGKQIDLKARALRFRDTVMPLTDAMDAMNRGQVEVVEQTLREAERKLDDMTRVIYGNMAAYLTEQLVLTPLGISMDRTTWQFSRCIGHTGASDQLLSLNHLLVTGQLTAGDHVLLAGSAPATASSAVLEILDVPEWAQA